MSGNVAVMGLNAINRAKLETLRGAAELTFHGILDPAELYDTEVFDMVPLLCERLGSRTTSLESLLIVPNAQAAAG